MDLRALADRAFAVFLGLAVVLVICAAVILVDPFSSVETRNHFTYLILIADGIMSLVSTTYLIISTRRQAQMPGHDLGGEQLFDEEPTKPLSGDGSEGEQEDEQS